MGRITPVLKKHRTDITVPILLVLPTTSVLSGHSRQGTYSWPRGRKLTSWRESTDVLWRISPKKSTVEGAWGERPWRMEGKSPWDPSTKQKSRGGQSRKVESSEVHSCCKKDKSKTRTLTRLLNDRERARETLPRVPSSLDWVTSPHSNVHS